MFLMFSLVAGTVIFVVKVIVNAVTLHNFVRAVGWTTKWTRRSYIESSLARNTIPGLGLFSAFVLVLLGMFSSGDMDRTAQPYMALLSIYVLVLGALVSALVYVVMQQVDQERERNRRISARMMKANKDQVSGDDIF